jgi:hypothetical protein
MLKTFNSSVGIVSSCTLLLIYSSYYIVFQTNPLFQIPQFSYLSLVHLKFLLLLLFFSSFRFFYSFSSLFSLILHRSFTDSPPPLFSFSSLSLLLLPLIHLFSSAILLHFFSFISPSSFHTFSYFSSPSLFFSSSIFFPVFLFFPLLLRFPLILCFLILFSFPHLFLHLLLLLPIFFLTVLYLSPSILFSTLSFTLSFSLHLHPLTPPLPLIIHVFLIFS